MSNPIPSYIKQPVTKPVAKPVEAPPYRRVTTQGDPAPPFVPSTIPAVEPDSYESASYYGAGEHVLGYTKPASVQAASDPPKPSPITVPTVNGVPQTELPHVPYDQPYLSSAIR